MLRVGLNPYGLAYTLGLQAQGTPRANPGGRGLEGFIDIARELGARVLEIYEPWLKDMDAGDLRALAARLAALDMVPIVSSGLTMGPFERALWAAEVLGAKVIRLGLTSVLCGDRQALGVRWMELVADVRAKLRAYAPQAAAAGISLAIENHQDFRSEELISFCREAGSNVGICLDTGNAFPVAEPPIDFTGRVSGYVRHVHLKDYRVQWTDEGYRLVRCAIGDGAVPIAEIVAMLTALHPGDLTAVLEPGALEARHVCLFRRGWWDSYPPTTAAELCACLAAAGRNRLPDDADYRTPWERGEGGEALIAYELDMIRRSAANMRALGLMGGREGE